MLDDATLDEVEQALLKSADIFHFAGHGFFLTKEKEPEAPDATLG